LPAGVLGAPCAGASRTKGVNTIRLLCVLPVVFVAVLAVAASNASVGSGASACPLDGVKLPGVLYVGMPLNHKSIPNFTDAEIEGLVAASYGWAVCFSVSKDGKRLLGYAYPIILLCSGGSGSFPFVSSRPRGVAIQKSGAFSAKTSATSFFKGSVKGAKASGTLRDKRDVKLQPTDPVARSCDTGTVRWTAKKVGR